MELNSKILDSELTNRCEELRSFYYSIEKSNYGLAKNLSHIRNRFILQEYKRLAKEILEQCPEGGRILDWGCGFGHMLHLLNFNHVRISGYDLSNERYNKDTQEWKLLINKFQLSEKVKYSKNESHLPYDNESFDIVISMGVLEHVSDTLTSCKEINRIMRKSGKYLIYELPNKYSVGEFLRKKLDKNHHDQLFTHASLSEILLKSGFEVNKIRNKSFLPRRMGPLPSLLPLVDRFPSALDKIDNFLAFFPPFRFFTQNLECISTKK